MAQEVEGDRFRLVGDDEQLQVLRSNGNRRDNMPESNRGIEQAYRLATERYAALGVDLNAALERLATIAASPILSATRSSSGRRRATRTTR